MLCFDILRIIIKKSKFLQSKCILERELKLEPMFKSNVTEYDYYSKFGPFMSRKIYFNVHDNRYIQFEVKYSRMYFFIHKMTSTSKKQSSYFKYKYD